MWRFARTFFTGHLIFKRAFQLTTFCIPRDRRFRFPLFAYPFALIWPFTLLREPDADTKSKELFLRSRAATNSGDFSAADAHLHELLYHLYRCHEEQLIETAKYIEQRATVYVELANVHIVMGRRETAVELLKHALQDSLAAGIPTDDAMFVEISLKLALLYEQLGKVEDARLGFEFCVQSQEDKLRSASIQVEEGMELTEFWSNELALLGMCCNYYAKFLSQQNEPLLALQLAERSLEVAGVLYAPSHLNRLHLLCDLASIECDLNQFEAARRRLQQAADWAQSTLREADPASPEFKETALCLAHIWTESVLVEAMSGCREKAGELVKQAEQLFTQVQNDVGVYRRRLNELKTRYSL